MHYKKQRHIMYENITKICKSSQPLLFQNTKKKQLVNEIIDLIGDNFELHVEVLSSLLKRAFKCPIKQKLLQSRNIFVSSKFSPIATTPERSTELVKNFRKIVQVRNKHKHQEADELSRKMKEDDISVRDISSATNESQRYVYRMLETPKKRVQEKYGKSWVKCRKRSYILLLWWGSIIFPAWHQVCWCQIHGHDTQGCILH